VRGTAVQPAALLSFSEGAGHGVSCSWVAVGLPGRLVTVGARTLLLSLGVIRAGRLGRVLRPGRVRPGLARDPAPVARGCASATASSRSCRAAASCTCLPRPRFILTARTRASEDSLTGHNHRQAPFRLPGQRNRAAPGGSKPGTPSCAPARDPPYRWSGRLTGRSACDSDGRAQAGNHVE